MAPSTQSQEVRERYVEATDGDSLNPWQCWERVRTKWKRILMPRPHGFPDGVWTRYKQSASLLLNSPTGDWLELGQGRVKVGPLFGRRGRYLRD